MDRVEDQAYDDLTEEMIERFTKLVDQSKGVDGCWPWMGDRRQDGYGLFRVELEPDWDDPIVTAHRMAWSVFSPIPVKHIPDDRVVSHTCGNKICCNPRHLIFLTRSEISRNGKKKFCKNGHELPAPKMVGGKLVRVCPECNKIRQAEYRKQKSAVLPIES